MCTWSTAGILVFLFNSLDSHKLQEFETWIHRQLNSADKSDKNSQGQPQFASAKSYRQRWQLAKKSKRGAVFSSDLAVFTTH